MPAAASGDYPISFPAPKIERRSELGRRELSRLSSGWCLSLKKTKTLGEDVANTTRFSAGARARGIIAADAQRAYSVRGPKVRGTLVPEIDIHADPERLACLDRADLDG